MLNNSKKVVIGILFGFSILLVISYLISMIWIVSYEDDLKGLVTSLFILIFLVPAGLFEIMGLYLLSGGRLNSLNFHHKSGN